MSLSLFSGPSSRSPCHPSDGGVYEPPARKRMEMADTEREAIVIAAIKRVGYP